MKTLLLTSIALMGLATAASAAPLPGVSSPPETQRTLAVPVAQTAVPNSGEVSESIPAGNYTYLHVKKDGKQEWLAIPRRDIPVGAEISYGNGAVMKDFHSAALNRTFDEVLFLGGVVVAGESPSAASPSRTPVPALPPGHVPVPTDPAVLAELPNVGKVSEAIAAGKYTYLHVKNGGKGTWIAIPNRDIPVGARVRYANSEPMTDFHSSSLNRTFKEVLFLGDVLVTEE